MAASFTVLRMYSDEAGECRFDAYDVPLSLQESRAAGCPVLHLRADGCDELYLLSHPAWLGWRSSSDAEPKGS